MNKLMKKYTCDIKFLKKCLKQLCTQNRNLIYFLLPFFDFLKIIQDSLFSWSVTH